MKPVKQQFIHDPESGLHGDCQRAVIASLLELDITDVPHFGLLGKDDSNIYWDELQKFVNKFGYIWLVTKASSPIGIWGYDGPIYHEISGPSPRGNSITHAVIGRNGEIVFDPHPSNAGLDGDQADWEHAYLVKL